MWLARSSLKDLFASREHFVLLYTRIFLPVALCSEMLLLYCVLQQQHQRRQCPCLRATVPKVTNQAEIIVKEYLLAARRESAASFSTIYEYINSFAGAQKANTYIDRSRIYTHTHRGVYNE